MSPYDNNAQLNDFKQQFNLQIPCAGTEGGAPEAIAKVIDGQVFYGYPAYSVICADKKLSFNVCFPPSVNCFDPYFLNCTAALAVDEFQTDEILNIIPNPSSGLFTLDMPVQGTLRLQISSTDGRLVLKEEYQSNGRFTAALNLNFLPEGLYFLSLKTENQTTTQKLLIAR